MSAEESLDTNILIYRPAADHDETARNAGRPGAGKGEESKNAPCSGAGEEIGRNRGQTTFSICQLQPYRQRLKIVVCP